MPIITSTSSIIHSAYCDEASCRWDADAQPDELVLLFAQHHAEKTGHRVGYFTQTTEFVSKKEQSA